MTLRKHCSSLKPARFYQGADKPLARPGRKQARKHVRDACDFNNMETRAVKFPPPFPQGKAPKEIHAILTETLACFLLGRAKDLSEPLYKHVQNAVETPYLSVFDAPETKQQSTWIFTCSTVYTGPTRRKCKFARFLCTPQKLNFKEICTIGLVKQVSEGKIEGRIEVTERRGRRRKQMLDDLRETRGYWKLKEVALDCTLGKDGFGRGCATVVGHTT